MDLFTLTGLRVALAMGSSPRSGTAYDVFGPDGGPVASIAMSRISLDGRFRRWFGNAAEYPFTLTVRDAAGGVVLTLDKPREGTYSCFFEVIARLADGREIGRVRKRWPLSEHLSFCEESGAEIATATTGRLTEGYRVQGNGTEWAVVEFDASKEGARSFGLSFGPDAPVLVRALTLAYVAASDAQMFPTGRAW